MDVSLSHAEVDQRADELARMVLLRNRTAVLQSAQRASLKKEHEEELSLMDTRIEKLANAVRNQREDSDAQLSISFVAGESHEGSDDSQADPSDALADHVSAEAERAEEAESEPEPAAPKKKGRKHAEAQA